VNPWMSKTPVELPFRKNGSVVGMICGMKVAFLWI